jgi:hypothetical protein
LNSRPRQGPSDAVKSWIRLPSGLIQQHGGPRYEQAGERTRGSNLLLSRPSGTGRKVPLRTPHPQAFDLDVSSWHPYCFLADWLTSNINCHPASLPGTYGKGLTVRDCKEVTSVECKGVNITQLGVSSIFSFLQETSLRGCENRNKEPRQVQDCRIEVAPLQPMQHGHAERGRRFALQSA